MNLDRIKNLALDVILRFNVTKYPIKNIAKDVLKKYRLNSKERALCYDLLFDFIRERVLFEHYLAEKVSYHQSISSQQKDKLLLEILLGDRYDYNEYKAKHENNVLALKPYLAKLLMESCPDQANLLKYLFKKPKKYLAIDTRFISPNLVYDALMSLDFKPFFHEAVTNVIGIDDEKVLDLSHLSANISAHLWFMDVGSQIIASMINPQRNDKVLDMCGGHGNKARYITKIPCDYYLVDIDNKRLAKAKQRLLSSINFIHADARNLSFPNNYFDWILLDSPCSGIGTMARFPDLMYRLDIDKINTYVALQQELLGSAVKLLNHGGILVYATCSLLAKENHQQIEQFLLKYPDMSLLAMKEVMPEYLNKAYFPIDKGFMSIMPHVFASDGFYFAIMRKVS